MRLLSTALILTVLGSLNSSVVAADQKQPPLELRLCENLPLWRLMLLGSTIDHRVSVEIHRKIRQHDEVVQKTKLKLSKQFTIYGLSTGIVTAGIFAAGGSPALILSSAAGLAAKTAGDVLVPPGKGVHLITTDILSRELNQIKQAALDVTPPLADGVAEDATETGARKLNPAQPLTEELLDNTSGQAFIELFGVITGFRFRYDNGRLIQFWTQKPGTTEAFQFNVLSQVTGEIEQFKFVGTRFEIRPQVANPEEPIVAVISLDIGLNQNIDRPTFCTQPTEDIPK